MFCKAAIITSYEIRVSGQVNMWQYLEQVCVMKYKMFIIYWTFVLCCHFVYRLILERVVDLHVFINTENLNRPRQSRQDLVGSAKICQDLPTRQSKP